MDRTGPWLLYKRHEALRKPEEYLFQIDEWRCGEHQMLFAHLDFFRFSPAIMKAVLTDWRLFRECVDAPLYAFGAVDDDKWERFVSLLGFRSTNQTILWEGEPRRLFLHHKD